MPRPLRLWFPGAWYHIVARGNNREAIFFTERDHRKYLMLLEARIHRYECRLHAYVLMTNHVHLLVETGQLYPIWKPMQSLHTAYSSYVNRTYKRVGHVFQGRYHALLVEQDAYALELSRYIHLNPVRAKVVASPLQYLWSSYGAYVMPGRIGQRLGLVTTNRLLGMINPQPHRQRALYRQFVLEGLADQARGLTPP